MRKFIFIFIALAALALLTCSRPPVREFYMLSYVPPPLTNRTMQNPYAAVIRLREFSIEEAYNRQQIVFRTNPFQLHYYNFKSWAVRPARMVTDLFFRHLNSVNLVSGVVRRFDEGRRPDFEIAGFIEAIQEFDSEDALYAHLALRVSMTRLSDGETVYNRHFDLRKKVFRKETVAVVLELSQILEYVFSEVITDIDQRLASEFGILLDSEMPEFTPVETPVFMSDDIEEGTINFGIEAGGTVNEE